MEIVYSCNSATFELIKEMHEMLIAWLNQSEPGSIYNTENAELLSRVEKMFPELKEPNANPTIGFDPFSPPCGDF